MFRVKKISNMNSLFMTALNGRFNGFYCRDRVAALRPPCDELSIDGNLAVKALIVLIVTTIGVGAWAEWEDFATSVERLSSNRLGLIYLYTFRVLLYVNLALFVWRLVLVSRYRPTPQTSDARLPTCSVIVPAYNEGKQVLRTLRSVARSDYPSQRLQIIAVDDGSKDDTWRWIEKAANQFPGRIETIRLIQNSGKRQALYDGFIRSRGDVIVTIDSDSLVEPQTIRRLVSPLVCGRKVGAVAGNVRVLNRHEGIIPRMLEVSFAFSFDFLRASQSEVNAVFCTPGALTAYRREALMKNLAVWMKQTFMGLPATIGEDRAMTNLILSSGYHVRFQSDAIVYTNVPVNYEGLCKMFLRWARSNVRETLFMGAFIFRKFRTGPVSGARINFLSSCIDMLVPKLLLAYIVGCVLIRPDVYLSQVLLGSAIVACVPALFYAIRRRSSDALWAFAYGIFWVAALWWIAPWAILTARNGKWLTRDVSSVSRLSPARLPLT
jgi:hyaluronan synthase